jgi:antitoxin component YwqK of YwqJK toxin-antitoxin module
MIKKTSFLFFTLFAVNMGLSAQNAPINKYDGEGKKAGVWETYYETGKVKSHGTFKQGHPVGLLVKYYPGGIVQANMNFDETGRISYVTLYYETGDPAAEGKYINQLKDSVWNYFSAYDKRKAVSESFVLGKKNGECYKYYAGGKPSEYQEWQNDQKNGKWEQYYETGQIRLTGYYMGDLLNGSFISYNPDGSISISGNYTSGAMDGTWIYNTETGEADLTVEYQNGKMLPNPEMEKRIDEFSKKVKDAMGSGIDETESPEELEPK